MLDIQCPICKTQLRNLPDDFPPRPFCSLRCKRVDLFNWLNGRYRVARPLEPDELPTEPSDSRQNP